MAQGQLNFSLMFNNSLRSIKLLISPSFLLFPQMVISPDILIAEVVFATIGNTEFESQ